MSSFSSVRSLERGLKILEALNRCHGAGAQQVARMVQLPRPTVYRLLETMQTLGYVTRSETDDAWHLTSQVKILSSGFHDDMQVVRVAAPILQALGAELIWPIDLVTFENDEMVIRESTHAKSPFSIDRGMAGRHLPLLKTSGGRAYLAFCPEEEREAILERLRRSHEEDKLSARDTSYINRLLSDTRRVGYGSRVEGFNPHTASISVPVRDGHRVLACVTIIWIASAMKLDEAVQRFFDPLKRASAQIEKSLRSAVPAA